MIHEDPAYESDRLLAKGSLTMILQADGCS
ncbi:hypothetical protein T296_11860 [Pantoea agglomerans Eh318]|nr:hypothetical protein T296_11860 [Pantoea agglomerans Eh318]